MAKTSAKKSIRGSRDHIQAPSYTKAKTPTKKLTQTPKDPLSYTKACNTAARGMKAHGKAKRTTENYDGHVQCGREFLAAFVKDQSKAESQWTNGEDSSTNLSAENEDQIPSKHPQFHVAFDGPPIECTPLALALFLAHKCFTENRGKSTAVAIHAGFKLHYDLMYYFSLLRCDNLSLTIIFEIGKVINTEVDGNLMRHIKNGKETLFDQLKWRICSTPVRRRMVREKENTLRQCQSKI